MIVQPSPSLISQGFSSRVVMPECNGIGLPLVIGEGPGKTEDDTGIPFHPEAEAGGLFKRLMQRVGVERPRFNIANVVMQRPPYNELYDAKGYPMAYTHEAIEYWKPFLHQTIEELQPPVIIGLGRTALETLTGFTDIGTTRGYVTETRINLQSALDCPDCGLGTDPDCFTCGGTGVIDGWDRRSLHIPAICTYHPAFLNYGQRHLSGVFIRDVLAALEIAESGWEAPSLKVTPSPSPEAFRAFCAGFQPEFHALTADIETPDTRGEDESTLEDAGKQTPIDRMSFCYATEIGGFSVPFESPYLEMAKDLIARAKVLRGWNWRLFDWPRLTQHGFTTGAREEDLIDCLAADTRVRLWSGDTKRIADIVNERDTQPLTGMDTDGRLIPVSPIGWHKRHVNEYQKWVRIRVDGNRWPIFCTPEHLIWTKNGWVEAAAIKVSDWIPVPQAGTADLIHGTLLGDGSVNKFNVLSFTHSITQAHWFEAKRAHIQGTPTVCAARINKIRDIRANSKVSLVTSSRVAKRWRASFYPKGKKVFVVPPSMAALAIWYGDDGNLKNSKRVYTGRMPWRSTTVEGDSWHGGDGLPRFCIQGYCQEDQMVILDYFKSTFGVDVSLHGYPDATLAVLRRSARDRFFAAIAPWLHPSMAYKLPQRYRGQYNGWLEEMRPQWAQVESVGEISYSLTEARVCYCVSVDHPTHRFFAEGGLVHNCWRHLHRTLPASVAFVAPFYVSMPPWKHEAHSQPEYYSAMDAIVTHLIGEGMEREMRASGQWETYQRHVVEIISTNHGVCTQMAKNGLPIDPEKIEAFKLELELKHKERLARLQELVPEALKPVKQKSGLKKVPKSLEGCIRRQFTVEVSNLTKEEKAALNDTGRFYEASEEVLVTRYCLLLPFNPTSHLQVKALIRHYGHKAKTDRKTKNETSSDDTLKSLVTKYVESKKASDVDAVEAYRLIRECRAIDKVLGTYVKGWKPASDGLIHATPGIWGDMFRVSWRRPNLTATIADKKEMQIASGFRKCIRVADDEMIVEADWKSQEAVLLAHYANDPDYMRLALLGLNGYMASHLLGRPADLSWSDKDLGRYLADIKHDKSNVKIYDDAKHTIYLVQNGGTPFLISELYEVTRTRAQYLYNFYFDLFPKIKRFQQQTLQKAHDECKLTNAWGYRMPFWSVFQWQQKRYERIRQLWVNHSANPARTVVMSKKDLDIVTKIHVAMSTGTEANDAIASLCYDLGDEAKGSLSFFPRDSGAAMLKDAMLAMEDEYQLASRGILRGCIHDATLSICKRKEVDEVAEIMRLTMERPLVKLNNLVIPVEIAIGQSWDKKSMEEWQGAAEAATA